MGATAKCKLCGMIFPDTHPSRKGNKFCCREHFNMFKKEHGTWNRGMEWKDMYSEKTYGEMKKRVTTKGKNHHMYGRSRVDITMRNLLMNPMKSKKDIKDLKEKIKENPDMVIDSLIKNMNPNKVYAYQRIAYEAYGKKCSKCGVSEGIQIDVHHKDGNRKNNKVTNLQVLCAFCHAKYHKL